jgi:hypothetical protein
VTGGTWQPAAELRTLEIMESSAGRPPPRPAARSFVMDAAVIGVVLGVLPLLWEAHLFWRLAGPFVAAVYLARASVEVWRRVFSTAPPDLTG